MSCVVSLIDDLQSISDRFEACEPHEILRWAVETFGDKLTMATAFGAEGCCIIHMLAEIGRPVRIFNLDTGYQFNETLQLRARIKERYGIEVEYVSSHLSVEQMEARYGGPLYLDDPGLCCQIRKVEPLRKAVEGYDAWISSIRRDETPERALAVIVEQDRKFDLVKVNPLANWTRKDVWSFLMRHQVPYNSLHDHDFTSIGCWPCTRRVRAGEDSRAGRWAGSQKQECGLHVIEGSHI